MSKTIYAKLIKKNIRESYLRKKWASLLLRDVTSQDISKFFQDIGRVTNVSKLRSFQYRLIHNAIVTNKNLYQWKIKSSPMCTFCDESEENMLHLFLNCRHTKRIWEDILPLLQCKSNVPLTINYETVLLNRIHPVSGHVCNLLCLVLKHYLYRTRCNGERPKVYIAREEIFKIENIEKYIAKKNGQEDKHLKKWKNVTPNTHNLNMDKNYVNEYIDTC